LNYIANNILQIEGSVHQKRDSIGFVSRMFALSISH